MSKDFNTLNLDFFSVRLPYTFVSGHYDLNNYQYRLLLLMIIRAKQAQENSIHVNTTPMGKEHYTVELKFRTKDLLNDDYNDENYSRCYKDIEELMTKVIKYGTKRDGKQVKYVMTTAIYRFIEDNGNIQAWIPDETWNMCTDFSRGYEIADLQTLFTLKSPYAIRLYQLVTGQKHPLRFSIDEFKSMLKLENKYSDNFTLFKERVIKVAQKELNEKSPYTFDFTFEKESSGSTGGRPKYNTIVLHPKQQKIDKKLFLNKDFFDSITHDNIATLEQFVNKAGIAGEQIYHVIKSFNHQLRVEWVGEKVNFLSRLVSLYNWHRRYTSLEEYQSTKISGYFTKWYSDALKVQKRNIDEGHPEKNIDLPGYVVSRLKARIKELEDLQVSVENKKTTK